MENRLDIEVVGGDIKHIGLTAARGKDIDQRGDDAADCKKQSGMAEASAAEVGPAAEPDKKADGDQNQMPEIAMQGQAPVYVGKAFRHEKCSDASQQSEILHKRTEGCL